MNLRRTVVVVIILGLVPIASASTFGTIPSDQVKTVEGSEAEFHIDVINMGDRSLEIEAAAIEKDPDTEVRFKVPGADSTGFRSFIMEPEEPKSNPKADAKWFATGDGGYVPLSRIKIKALVDENSEDQVGNFKVRVSATPLVEDGEKSENVKPSQSVVQVREYDFRLGVNGKKVEESGEGQRQRGVLERVQNWGSDVSKGVSETVGGFTGGNSGSPAPEAPETENSEPNVTVKDSEESSESSEDNAGSLSESSSTREEKQSETTKASEKPEQSITGKFAAQVNFTTAALLIGFIVSALYLIRVI